jgi:SAM-dependent methyltransferase
MSITADPLMESKEGSMQYPGLRQQPDQNGRRGALMAAARRFLRSQFGRPTGVWGSLAGAIMARRRSNLQRIHSTLALLQIQPRDRVLEIGFGPGIAIQQASRIASKGFVAGVDHSPVMVRQAAKRNARAIGEGRVALRLGSASDVGPFEEPFDKIFTINSFHFWSNPVQCLEGLRDRLRPGGLIAVAVQPRSRGATDATAGLIGEELVANLARAGFSNCRLELMKTTGVPAACALGNK